MSVFEKKSWFTSIFEKKKSWFIGVLEKKSWFISVLEKKSWFTSVCASWEKKIRKKTTVSVAADFYSTKTSRRDHAF